MFDLNKDPEPNGLSDILKYVSKLKQSLHGIIIGQAPNSEVIHLNVLTVFRDLKTSSPVGNKTNHLVDLKSKINFEVIRTESPSVVRWRKIK